MARIRTIKPEFFTSEDIVLLSPLARLLYIALWCEADRDGRLVWKPKTFKIRYLPVDNCDVEAIAAELVSGGLVILYGEGFAYIPSFGKHQNVNPRETASKLPCPDGYERLPARKVSGGLREEVIARDNYRCVRCGSSDDLTVDHILPQSAGGPHVRENLRAMCVKCNCGRPVSGPALREDLFRDGYDLDELKRRYSRVTKESDASNLDVHAQGGREGKGREGKGIRPSAAQPVPETKPVSEKKPIDLKAEIFGAALEWLAQQSGRHPDKLRPLVGRWCKHHGDAQVLDAFMRAKREGPVEPVAWIEGALRGGGKRQSAIEEGLTNWLHEQGVSDEAGRANPDSAGGGPAFRSIPVPSAGAG